MQKRDIQWVDNRQEERQTAGIYQTGRERDRQLVEDRQGATDSR